MQHNETQNGLILKPQTEKRKISLSDGLKFAK